MDRPDPNDRLTALPRDAYQHLFLTLRAAMPAAVDGPRGAYLRDQAAIAQVSGLCPANAAEAALAAQFAAAQAGALACLARAQDIAIPRAEATAETTQARGLMRLAQAALGMLVRMQTLRSKRDADETSASHAAWAEHAAASWMLESSLDEGLHPMNHDPETNPMQLAPPSDAYQPLGTPDDGAETIGKRHAVIPNPVLRDAEAVVIRPTEGANGEVMLPAGGAQALVPPEEPDRPSHGTRYDLGNRYHETNMVQAEPGAIGGPSAASPVTGPVWRPGSGAGSSHAAGLDLTQRVAETIARRHPGVVGGTTRPAARTHDTSHDRAVPPPGHTGRTGAVPAFRR